MRRAAGLVRWPVELHSGDLVLRPLRRHDEAAWMAVRGANSAWLDPWEATDPGGGGGAQRLSFRAYAALMNREAKAGRALPWVMEYDGQLAGQVTVSSITRGSLCSGSIGYWIDRRLAGRSLTPLGVAMAIDHCLGPGGLHRIEIAIRPENRASLRVVEKLGLREEGMRLRYLHIAGAWADHRCFAITAEELGSGLVTRWTRRGESQ